MYEFILADLSGTEFSELAGASEKRFAQVMRSIGTAGGRVPLAHEDADTILECNSLLKVYEVNDNFLTDGDKVLMHAGRIVGAEETSQGRGSVKFTSADAGWITTRRLIGKLGQVIGGVTTTAAGYKRGDVLAQVNRATIIEELLDAINADDPSGLRAGDISSASSTYVADWRYKPMIEALTELTASLDGPDWCITPIEPEPSDGAVAYHGELQVGSLLGEFKEDAAFEYGDGLNNVGDYRRPVTLDGTANRVFHPPSGADAGAVLSKEHEASIADRGLLEATVQADLTVEDLRQRLLEYHLALRYGPKQTITFDPVRNLDGRVPRLGRDFEVGDIVPFRAWLPVPEPDLDPTRPTRIDINVRTYQAEVNVDSAGTGTYTLTVTPNAGG